MQHQSVTQVSGYDVVPLARMAQGGRWRTESMRSYSRPVLIWFTKGQGRITISGVKRGYGGHNAVFLPAGTMHGFDMLGQVFGQIVFFPAGPDLGLPDEPVHLRIRDARRQAEMTGFVEQLQSELEKSDDASPRALDLIAGLLGVWINRQAELRDPDIAELNAASRLASAYCALLERDFRRPKSVATYAKELGVTPTHLSRVCNQVNGRPASDLRSDRVLTEARRMLSQTQMPVQDIAQSLGFASHAYFTRAFAKHVGTTPTAFRKQGSNIPA